MFLDDQVMNIPIKRIVVVCGGLPLGAFAVCVVTALTLHGEKSTRTHCGVTNYLPSISSAIGGYAPERYIWRFCIALHCAPRFLVGIMYRSLYRSCPLRKSSHAEHVWLEYLSTVLVVLHVIENASLLGLTIVSSIDEHSVHVVFFTLFIVSSTAYMTLNTYLFDHSGRRRSFSSGELSYQYKCLSLIVMLSALVLAIYFYYRHNAYCEPGVYTLFALCEYTVVVCNMVYHSTLAIDMADRQLCIMSVHNMDTLLPTYDKQPLLTKDT